MSVKCFYSVFEVISEIAQCLRGASVFLELFYTSSSEDVMSNV